MKLIVFLIAVLAAAPAGHFLRRRPDLRIRAWTVVGLLPFLSSFDMALVFFGERPGDTHGIEVALIDWIALTMLIARGRWSRPLPFRAGIAAYIGVAALSVTQAYWALGAAGYVWKLLRMLVLYAAVFRSGEEDPRVPDALLRGMVLGVIYEAALVTWQHFGLGIHRAPGSFAHENTLGMIMNLVVMAPIALAVAGRASWLLTLAPLAAVPIALFTVSRGTLLFLGMGGVLIYIASALRRLDRRKVALGAAGLALGLALLPVVITTLGSRPAAEKDSSMRLRRDYENAASLMLEDHPLGIGANHFTSALTVGGYGERAGVDWTQRFAIVHNVYWLTAAELGYVGVIALALVFAVPLLTAFRYGLIARDDRRGDFLLGLGVALLATYAHGFFEWVWRDTTVSHVFWMIVGMVAVIARQVRAGLPGTTPTRAPVLRAAPRRHAPRWPSPRPSFEG
jgi:O-antigen ligase